MTDLIFDDPCLLFALGREAKPFLREFRVQQRFGGSPCWARFCGPAWLSVLVVRTGIGLARMQTALDWLLARPKLGNVAYRPKLVLSAGFSGALQERYRVGDIVLATEVVDVQGKCWPVTWPAQLPAGSWQPPLHRGRLLTVSELVHTPEQKQTLGQQFEAACVDMECAAVAAACTHHGIPFGCVRAVSDDARTKLPTGLAALLSGGQLSIARLCLATLRSPTLIRELWRLAGQTRFAAHQLAKALGELLTLTLPWAV